MNKYGVSYDMKMRCANCGEEKVYECPLGTKTNSWEVPRSTLAQGLVGGNLLGN